MCDYVSLRCLHACKAGPAYAWPCRQQKAIQGIRSPGVRGVPGVTACAGAVSAPSKVQASQPEPVTCMRAWLGELMRQIRQTIAASGPCRRGVCQP